MVADDRVQIVIRLTGKERELIKERARKADKSMNQFILDSVIDSGDSAIDIDVDSESDSNDTSFILNQIAQKDEQLKRKDDQLFEMQRLLSQQQELSLQDKKEKDQLRLELKEVTPPEYQNKNFIQRLFNL